MLSKLNLKNNSNFTMKSCLNCSSIQGDEYQHVILANRYDYYYRIYCLLVVSALIMSTARVIIFFRLSLNSSKYLHKAMFKNVISTNIRFFDLNPLGKFTWNIFVKSYFFENLFSYIFTRKNNESIL